MSLHHGARVGPNVGLRVSPHADDVMDFDPVSRVYVPSTRDQWANFKNQFQLTTAAPTNLYLCQNASGNLTDAFGVLDMTPGGTPLYSQTATGWNRLGVGGDDNTGDFFGTTGGGNITTTSQMWMVFIRLGTVPSGNRVVCGPTQHGFATGSRIIFSGNKLSNQCVTNFTTGSFVHTVGNYAIFKKYDRTAAEDVGGDQNEFLSTTYNPTVTNASHGISSNLICPGNCQFVYVMRWDGADAEMTQAQIRALLQAFGWAVSW